MSRIDGLLNDKEMGYKIALELIKADYKRYSIGSDNLLNISRMMMSNRGFAYLVWLRFSAVKGWIWPLSRLIHRHLSTKYRITIQPHTRIAGGLYFPNCWNIVINPNCIVGRNVTIHEYVNIGANNGKSAIIGDYATINSRVCIVGEVNIGNDTTIMTGSVVTKDVEPLAIVEGIPAKKIIEKNNEMSMR